MDSKVIPSVTKIKRLSDGRIFTLPPNAVLYSDMIQFWSDAVNVNDPDYGIIFIVNDDWEIVQEKIISFNYTHDEVTKYRNFTHSIYCDINSKITCTTLKLNAVKEISDSEKQSFKQEVKCIGEDFMSKLKDFTIKDFFYLGEEKTLKEFDLADKLSKYDIYIKDL